MYHTVDLVRWYSTKLKIDSWRAKFANFVVKHKKNSTFFPSSLVHIQIFQIRLLLIHENCNNISYDCLLLIHCNLQGEDIYQRTSIKRHQSKPHLVIHYNEVFFQVFLKWCWQVSTRLNYIYKISFDLCHPDAFSKAFVNNYVHDELEYKIQEVPNSKVDTWCKIID
jgi:hypothetical protein